MTWLELINELRKCPLCLLEKQAVICEEETGTQHAIAQLVGPNNPAEDGMFWWKQMEQGYPDAYLSITFEANDNKED